MLIYLKNPLKPYSQGTCITWGHPVDLGNQLARVCVLCFQGINNTILVQLKYSDQFSVSISKMFPAKCCHACLHLIIFSDFVVMYCIQISQCFHFPYLFLSFACLPIAHFIKLSIFISFSFFLSLSTGVTDKELPFMHEEGIRDPSFYICEDKEVNTEHTSEK